MINLKKVMILAPAAAVLILFASCSGEEPAAAEKIRPVRTMQVVAVGEERSRTFSGTAQASTESRLSFKVAGTISTLTVKVGDKVNRGQIIAELDPADYQLRVEQVEESLGRAQVEARNARQMYEDIRELYERDRVSRADYNNARTASEAADKAVASIEKQLELAIRQLEYTRLSAPAQGTVSAVSVEVNENVGAGYPVVNLITDSALEVVVSVPEAFISMVQQGGSVDVTFDAIPGRTFPATITEVGVTTGQRSATYPVTVLLDERSGDVRSGMAAEVRFSLRSAGSEKRILVPSVAVSEDRRGRFVFVTEQSDPATRLAVVHRRSVQIGELTGDSLEIVEGLAEGETIVTAGVSRIKDGIKVKLLEDEGAEQ